jgi:lon-related putative ATP-dependent protease
MESLRPEQIRNVCRESLFEFESTEEVAPLEEIIGQERAVAAIDFGMAIESQGFNIFALGPTGAGKTSIIQDFVEKKAEGRAVPDDWCYVYNFDEPHKPNALRMPAGRGKEFRNDMERLINEVKTEIVQVFEREEYENEKSSLMERLQSEQNSMLSELSEKAKKEGFLLQRGPTGIFIMPVKDDQPLSGEAFAQLGDSEKKELEEQGKELRQDLNKTLRAIREKSRDTREQLEQLERNTVLFAIQHPFEDMKEAYADVDEVGAFLEAVKEDILEHARDIIASESEGDGQPAIFGQMMRGQQGDPLERYRVNLMVDNSGVKGAPVIVERNPIHQNLVGKLERQARMGMLVTNFRMIKPGALHRANGGYLILEAQNLLTSPYSYQSLKNAMKERKIRITDLGEMFSSISTAGLEPEPIPLDVKVILIGNPYLYYLLFSLDEEFRELFKIKADFHTFMERNEENMKLYARFLASRCDSEGWRHFDRSGIARVVEYGSELVGDQTKLSARFSEICDIAREANHWAQNDGNGRISRANVDRAIEARIYRNNRIEEQIQELIQKGDIFIDTDGTKIGQVNGLSILSLGDYAFAKPSRITARTYVGREGVVNIDREVKMAGPIHNKGVLILAGYLNGRYGVQRPVSLSASLVFEQLYEGVEGDSASSAELYALISSISEIPIKQGLAVTGSVNQRGEIQPIGGVTQKVEGFFKVCKTKGLNGENGVLIPKSNVKNLMLREEVVKAVEAGKFHIYPVETIDQGIEILTGVQAGTAGDDGEYPEGSVNNAVDRRLAYFATCLKRYRTEAGRESGEEAGDGDDRNAKVRAVPDPGRGAVGTNAEDTREE